MEKIAINERDITSIKHFLNKLLSQEGMNPNEKIKNTCLLFWVNAYGFFSDFSQLCVAFSHPKGLGKATEGLP